jgi:hypothetical protein
MLFKLFTLFSMFTLGLGASVNKRQYYVQQPWNYGGLLGQTVTVTETHACTIPPTPTETSSHSSSGGDSKDLNSQKHCLHLFNKFRKSQNLPLFKSATKEQIACADKLAVYDAAHGYHVGFYLGLCPGAASSCECVNGVGVGIPESVPGDPLQNCIQAYIDEHTYGLYSSEHEGHYLIIKNPQFRSVACGTDHNGFYTHNFYN